MEGQAVEVRFADHVALPVTGGFVAARQIDEVLHGLRRNIVVEQGDDAAHGSVDDGVESGRFGKFNIGGWLGGLAETGQRDGHRDEQITKHRANA